MVRDLRDLELAEDAVQDAVAKAFERWPREGVPERPGAWITTVARRGAVDALRRDNTRTNAHDALATLTARLDDPAPEAPSDSTITDDRLRLVFMCAHPALATDAQVALTLRSN